jgi:hypothetical protein
MQNKDMALSQDAIQQLLLDLQEARKQGPKFICQSPQLINKLKLEHMHKLATTLAKINNAYSILQSSNLSSEQKNMLHMLLEQIAIENVAGKYWQELNKLIGEFPKDTFIFSDVIDFKNVMNQLQQRIEEANLTLSLSVPNQKRSLSHPMLNVIEEYIAGKEKNLVIIGQKVCAKELPVIFKMLMAKKDRYTREQLDETKQSVYKKIAKTTAKAHNWRLVGVVFLALCLPPISLISLCWTLPWLKHKRQERIIERTVLMSEWQRISALRQSLKSAEKKPDPVVNKQGELKKCQVPNHARQTMTLFMTAHQAQRFDLLRSNLDKPIATRAKLKEELEISKAQSRAYLIR